MNQLVGSAGMLDRAAQMQRRTAALRAGGVPDEDIFSLMRYFRWSEAEATNYGRFGLIVSNEGRVVGSMTPGIRPIAPSGPVYRRVLREGPMNGFGYSWFDDRLARAGLTRPRLLARQPAWDGPSYGYEALNLVDGRRSVGEVRDMLAATLGPVPAEEVAEYLDVLARLGVLERVSG